MNIFMMATHPAVVDHESQMFHALGHNVYTAGWATGINAYGGKYEHNKMHFFQGKCDFLDEADQKILSKIDISWPDVAATYPDVGEVLVKNFDIFYVSQITTWLTYYSVLFLEANKKVIFRTFGFGPGGYSWFPPLFKYPNMYVVPSYNRETAFYGNTRCTTPIMLAMREELVDTSLLGDDGYIFAIVNAGNPSYWNIPKNKVEALGASYYVHDYVKGWLTTEELAKKFARCRIYVDFWKAPPKSATFEAMLYKKPVLLHEGGQAFNSMVETGFPSGSINCYHSEANGFQSQVELIVSLYHSPEKRQEIVNVQSKWQADVTKRSELAWKELLK